MLLCVLNILLNLPTLDTVHLLEDWLRGQHGAVDL